MRSVSLASTTGSDLPPLKASTRQTAPLGIVINQSETAPSRYFHELIPRTASSASFSCTGGPSQTEVHVFGATRCMSAARWQLSLSASGHFPDSYAPVPKNKPFSPASDERMRAATGACMPSRLTSGAASQQIKLQAVFPGSYLPRQTLGNFGGVTRLRGPTNAKRQGRSEGHSAEPSLNVSIYRTSVCMAP